MIPVMQKTSFSPCCVSAKKTNNADYTKSLNY